MRKRLINLFYDSKEINFDFSEYLSILDLELFDDPRVNSYDNDDYESLNTCYANSYFVDLYFHQSSKDGFEIDAWTSMPYIREDIA